MAQRGREGKGEWLVNERLSMGISMEIERMLVGIKLKINHNTHAGVKSTHFVN